MRVKNKHLSDYFQRIKEYDYHHSMSLQIACYVYSKRIKSKKRFVTFNSQSQTCNFVSSSAKFFFSLYNHHIKEEFGIPWLLTLYVNKELMVISDYDWLHLGCNSNFLSNNKLRFFTSFFTFMKQSFYLRIWWTKMGTIELLSTKNIHY